MVGSMAGRVLVFGGTSRNQLNARERGRIPEGHDKARPIKRAVRANTEVGFSVLY
jgi:hypothetical protein